MNIHPSLNLKPTPAQFIILASFLITAVFNFPFIFSVYQTVSPESLSEWVFILSVPTVLTLINIIFLSFFGAFFFPRITVALTLLISASLLYASYAYGIIFDKSMIQNIMETNSGEALSYLNSSLLVFFLLLGLIPVVAVFNQEINGKFAARIKSLLTLNILALISLALIGATLYKDYAAVGRNNKSLTKYIIPYAFYDAGYKYLRDTYFYPPLPFKVLDTAPTIRSSYRDIPKTTVVVVGETARADKFAINGYSRPTTPFVQSSGAVSFSNVTSCGTATAVSVPCMFSRLDRTHYDPRIAESQDNVIDIIRRAGVAVKWIDNNSSCKGVCKRIETIEYDPLRDPKLCDGDYCFDEILIDLLKTAVDTNSQEHKLIVLHMIGSHGPTYYRRYPEAFARFQPDCPRSDIQNCDQQALINTYDNTILYTDYVLGQIIEFLSTLPNSAMLYISDHGESLGEKGLYLHGFPYQLAPNEQTHVPMIYWDPKIQEPNYRACINQLSHNPLSQDNLYDTLLGLTKVSSSTYQPTKDVLLPCDP